MLLSWFCCWCFEYKHLYIYILISIRLLYTDLRVPLRNPPQQSAKVSGCLCQTFHHAGVCSCRWGPLWKFEMKGWGWVRCPNFKDPRCVLFFFLGGGQIRWMVQITDWHRWWLHSECVCVTCLYRYITNYYKIHKHTFVMLMHNNRCIWFHSVYESILWTYLNIFHNHIYNIYIYLWFHSFHI